MVRTWAVAMLALGSVACIPEGLIDPDKVTDWAAAKAARMLECQVIDATTERERRDCLGEFASDLGTSVCEGAATWVREGVSGGGG